MQKWLDSQYYMSHIICVTPGLNFGVIWISGHFIITFPPWLTIIKLDALDGQLIKCIKSQDSGSLTSKLRIINEIGAITTHWRIPSFFDTINPSYVYTKNLKVNFYKLFLFEILITNLLHTFDQKKNTESTRPHAIHRSNSTLWVE